MGDRTYVTLTVRRADKKRVLQICEEAGYEPNEPDQSPEITAFVNMGFEEVNYGMLPFLDELEKAGIPFDSNWAAGCEYTEGTRYGRYNSAGELVFAELYEEDFAIWIDDLMRVIHDYTELTSLIRERYACVQTPSWDEQEHNAKLFQTKQLITQ